MSETGIILQARTDSTRMPEKVILPFFQEKSILDLLLEKTKKLVAPVVLATTLNPSDDRICRLAEKHEVPVFRGSENDVLDRFIQAARKFGFSKIIRVCADNPFLDFTGMQTLIREFDVPTPTHPSVARFSHRAVLHGAFRFLAHSPGSRISFESGKRRPFR